MRGLFLCSCAAHCLFQEECRLPAAGDAGSPPPRGDSFCAAARHIAFFKKNAAFRRQGMRGVRPRAGTLSVQRCSTLPFLRSVPQAAPGCGVSAPARRVPFRMHEKEPKVHIRGVPLMYPPEGCPPLAGWKGHACQCPPRPVFCPDRPRPLAPGCAAKPHYTVPDRAGLPSLPGWGTRGGVADPSPVRRILPERRA